MTTFYLVRHGACDGLGETLWGRTTGVRLNKEGKAQVQRLAKRFSNVTLDAVYSSPLERALETADAIARAAKLEVKQSPAFNEIDFGYWSGKSFDALSLDERWRRFNTHRSVTKIPGGETFQAVQARANAELERLSKQHKNSRVVIVSHADVIKAAVGHVAHTPIDLLQRYEISPGSVSIIVADEHDTELLTVNSA
ncbi:MAG TPA: histidine phosphatase family protein [Pyrinomonadaceae bacterium]|nr:histidine phosphatase family protein [Pyrinomonadaceae bacterium]